MSRLVVRIKLPPREPPPAPERPPLRKGALLLIAGAVAVMVALVAFYMLRSEPEPDRVAGDAAPTVVDQPPPQPAPQTVEPQPVAASPAVPPSPSAINEVIPDVPRSALNTISGTIRVTIRAIVDKEGKVLDATVQEQGASRYFARLALDAARKWTFAPSTSQEQRVLQIRFYFKRGGVTARSSP